MSQTGVQFKLRLPPMLHAQIAAAAFENNRSLGSEIIARLTMPQQELRDQFAGQALMGSVTHKEGWDGVQQIAEMSYRLADAMLAARAK